MTEGMDDTREPGDEPVQEDANEGYSDLPVEEQVAALRRDLADARNEAGQNLDLAQRSQAELVNYRRRADEEKIELQKFSNSRLIIKMLPVVDELDLAINHAGNVKANSSWLEGVKLIQRKVATLLESEGVAKIEALGVMFDPLEHEALSSEESAKYPPGYVTEVVRNGYRLHGRVIQPAQVVVAR